MLEIILIMLAGIAAGAVFRRSDVFRHVGRTISATICLMLFLLGISAGSNRIIIENLATIGLEALVISLAGIAGSILAGWFVYRKFYREKENICQIPSATTGNGWKNRLSKLKDSFIIVLFFIAGTVAGIAGIPESMIPGQNVVMYILYLLMFQVGISLGYDRTLKKSISEMKPTVLLVPAATISGTLLFSLLISFFLRKWSAAECMAVGSGFGYYSLSSVLIAQYKEAAIGSQMAAELGTIALMSNIFREITALLFTPLITRFFGKIAPICTAGATSIDVALPVLIKYCGKEYTPVILIQGVIVDFSVPFLVSFFCSI